MELNSATLHHQILRDVLARGFAPSVAELAERFACSRETLSAALRALADDHGVVLHPGSDEVWVVHPFSNAPTAFAVRAGERRWWANCAWCALGVAELAGGSAEIATTLGAEGEPARVRIAGGRLLDPGYVVHFPIPMTRAWDNVLYTCSLMLLFESEPAVDAWCRRHGQPKGDVRPVEQVWGFAREWYGRHLDEDWRKWTAEEAAALFRRHGLDGPIWEIPASAERF